MSIWEILLFYVVCFFIYFLFFLFDILRAKNDDLISDFNNKKEIKAIFYRCKRKWAKDITLHSIYKSFDDYVSFEINKKFEYEKYIDYYTWGVKIGGQEKEN